MMADRRSRLLLCVAVLTLVWLQTPAGVDACPFCSEERGPTLVGDFNQASLVLLGTFANFKPNLGNDLGGTTEFFVEKALKPHEVLKGRNKVTFNKAVPATKGKYIVFCDVYKGEIDPYRGVEVPADSDLVSYLTESLAKRDRPAGERLRLAFNYLTSSDLEVSMDAYREFAKADYKDYKDMAKSLPADTIGKWLQDPKTPAYRYGLYASLLGHCGNPEKHGNLLRTLLDDPEKRKGSGIDGMLASYVMLQPKEGWKYVKGLLNNAEEEFLIRYAALRTARFLWGERPDLLPQGELVAGVAQSLAHPDMADFVIEDLRKWQRWELSDRILNLFEQETHNVPVIRRAILRYALRCPNPRAASFVREQRRLDADWVNDAEELLRLEQEAPVEVPAKTR